MGVHAEVRQAVRDRRDLAAVDIVRTVQTQEVRQAVERVLRLPDDADPDLVRGDPDTLDAALAVDSACEMWGSMVFEGVVDQHMLDRIGRRVDTRNVDTSPPLGRG